MCSQSGLARTGWLLRHGGEQGGSHPGLIKAATANEAAGVNENKYDGYYSSAKTCEMSLSVATGKNYQSLFYLLEETIQ